MIDKNGDTVFRCSFGVGLKSSPACSGPHLEVAAVEIQNFPCMNRTTKRVQVIEGKPEPGDICIGNGLEMKVGHDSCVYKDEECLRPDKARAFGFTFWRDVPDEPVEERAVIFKTDGSMVVVPPSLHGKTIWMYDRKMTP